MKMEEAIVIVISKYPNFKLVSVVDYDNFFVFNIVPPGYNIARDGEWFGGLTAVDKRLKTTLTFNPLMHNPSAYAKAVKDNIKYFTKKSAMI